MNKWRREVLPLSEGAPTPLSNQCRAIILGSILGDGSLKIHKNYRNARFAFRHSKPQESYFRWKASLLEEISSEVSIFPQKPDGFSRNDKFRYQSVALESLTELYQLTHWRGRFHIRRKWLNMIKPISLAIWWLDDGSIIGNGRSGVFCTDNFPKKSVETLAQYLRVVWGINATIIKVRLKLTSAVHYRLRLGGEEIRKLLLLILPYIRTEEMLAKVLLLYKNPEIQQRWISEVATLTGFSKEIVSRRLQEKKQKWKHFRE